MQEVTNGTPDGSPGGQPRFHTRIMVRSWPYASTQAIHSSREAQRALVENVAFRVAAHNQTPSYRAPSRFRTQHGETLGNLLEPTVTLTSGKNLVQPGNVTTCSTQGKAYARKPKVKRNGRMGREAAHLKRHVDAYLEGCDE